MNKAIGDNYELFILNKLKQQHDNAWLWKDIPENVLFDELVIPDYKTYLYLKQDVGIDILVKSKTSYIYVQCKNFTENCICIKDLAGYLAFKIKFPTKQTMVYYNGTLSHRIMHLLYSQEEYINMPFENTKVANKNIVTNDFEIRQYQNDAVLALSNENRSVLCLPCGMGKTYASYLIAKNYDNIIIFSPTKELTNQTSMFYKSKLENHTNILISCDGDRDLKSIQKKLKTKNLISSTYKSSDITSKLIESLKNTIIIIDEFHNLSENNFNVMTDNFYKIFNSKNKILFISATPKCTNYKNIIGTNSFGYSWNDSIKNKYINDFKIYLPDSNYSNLTFEAFLNIFKIDVLNNVIPNNKLTMKMYFIMRSLLCNGNKKCIIYSTDINKATQSRSNNKIV